MPMEARIAAVFVLGACLGAAVNWAIYTLAWNPRPIGPWSRPDPSAPARSLWDRLPVFGWLGLRREASLHGPGFWVRPMLLELGLAVGLAALYDWEIRAAGLLPPGLPRPLSPDILAVLHQQFAAHVVLIAFMLAASMIDCDEKIIPDAVTLPCTLLGLLAAAAWPWSLPPDASPIVPGRISLRFMQLASPNAWPDTLQGAPNVASLALGLGCWWLWCAAVLPRTWYARHGLRRAAALCWARIVREPSSYRILRMALVGALAVALVWHHGREGWMGLLSALVGMAAGGGLVWMVRVFGGAALGREAMGFGDVTLMAMLGAFLGWQASLMIFFLAPLAAVLVGILRLILFRDKEIPYGPFLCLAALGVLVGWHRLWDAVWLVFEPGWLVPAVVACCPPMLGAMLLAWRRIRESFGSESSDS